MENQIIFKNYKYTDDRFVWHCEFRHTDTCKTKYFVCRGTECRDYSGCGIDPKYKKINKNKE